jgi:hypothetical protein
LTNPDRTPGAPEWSESNHPRETVSWHEAMAFCAWLAHKLALDVRLPTEWQWERAASGRDGRTYPWGNEYHSGCANINETYGDAGEHHLGRTSAVGIYPHGASAEGVCDLAGNVWEWCRNEYEHPERTGPKGSQSRGVRGGSWNNNLDNARAGYRNNNHPDNRNNNIGFRVVVLSHIHLRPLRYRQVWPITVGWMRARDAGWRGCVRSVRQYRRRANTQKGRRPGEGFAASYSIATAVWRIHPPRSLPISATIRLTCSYCPSESHRQEWASRKYKRSLFSDASASASRLRRAAPR